MSDTEDKKPIGPRDVALFALPVLIGIGVLALTFWRGWEPWFGYAAVIAGVLGAVMLAGERLGVKGG
ncbi:MAG: hypothetical protein ABL308_09785 [Oceanicaulis sp.]